ncbi:MAG: glucosamine-6-phosphate deaminase [Candidatus Izemoplasmataceae bacterium]
MDIIVTDDHDALSNKASEIILECIHQKPGSVLGLATGRTPVETYRKLVQAYEADRVDFSHVKVFHLDEYLGLDKDDSDSYSYYLHETLLDKVNLRKENIHLISERLLEKRRSLHHYDRLIDRNGGIDLQLLGIGSNGHIGFNEPDTDLYLDTHIAKLAKETIRTNRTLFNDKSKMPSKAITMGIRSVFKARRIILLASGPDKSDIMNDFIHSETITPSIPATFLKLHGNVTVIIDKAAAQKYLDKKGNDHDHIN